ncbi:FkbM family methyltransferase [Cyanobium sp. WAJ14-Wanaka]|uniref:FkbM family methyltransferase n=1 Tax=Cyanobium sp. WAJ14-Wanaka TaxID=2823725 RepID=UPI0020CE1E39|nr:FkbM family methyltransferase [Cyanobium sp. WAJ14-Wanaka]MCP9775671.1 FkbM family methyltransferase [Cyanobium sp. WAJ14-Wanaka]
MRELISTCVPTTAFSKTENVPVEFGEFGSIVFPLYNFGNLDSLALFGIDELILFSFYLCNKTRYQNVLDIGANIGLHSIVMSKIGWNVIAFEPDPLHCEVFMRNMVLNKATNVEIVSKAVYDKNSNLSFVRVEGNTTGSHIQGMKKDPYGKLSELQVDCVDIADHLNNIDFIKLDAEGAEFSILSRIPSEYFKTLDIMAEISTDTNAQLLFDYMKSTQTFNIFSQKSGWKKVKYLSDLPTSHRGGSVFITSKDSVPFH